MGPRFPGQWFTPGRRVLVLAGLFVVGLFALSGFTRAVHGPSFCASCHVMKAASVAMERSVHADVPCLACHEGSGLLGALAYAPSLARESIDSLVGFGAGKGMLAARPCSDCHGSALAPGESAAKTEHPGAKADCRACHGRVVHLAMTSPSQEPKPRESHKAGWTGRHGVNSQKKGAECAKCHPQLFCKSCHGTEIPHKSDWMKRHVRDERTGRACLTCHVARDCESCHARHGIHPEQSLYR